MPGALRFGPLFQFGQAWAKIWLTKTHIGRCCQHSIGVGHCRPMFDHIRRGLASVRKQGFKPAMFGRILAEAARVRRSNMDRFDRICMITLQL